MNSKRKAEVEKSLLEWFIHRPRKPFDNQKCGELLPDRSGEKKAFGGNLVQNMMEYPEWGVKPPDKPSMRSIIYSLDSKIESSVPVNEIYMSDSERDMLIS